MPERPDEEGYIAHWDARQGRGHIRAALPAPAMLPFSRADLQPASLQPRLGMAVRFTRQAGPSGERALTVRPWLPDEAPPPGSGGRRSRRPVFQATGAAPLEALPIDPLQRPGATDQADPSHRRPVRPIRPVEDETAAPHGMAAGLDELGPQPTRPAPLAPVATRPRSGRRTASGTRLGLPRWLVAAVLAGVFAAGLGLLLGWFSARA